MFIGTPWIIWPCKFYFFLLISSTKPFIIHNLKINAIYLIRTPRNNKKLTTAKFAFMNLCKKFTLKVKIWHRVRKVNVPKKNLSKKDFYQNLFKYIFLQ